MNTMYEILLELWYLIGANVEPPYFINNTLYILSLLTVVLILISPFALIWLIISIVKGSLGGYNG